MAEYAWVACEILACPNVGKPIKIDLMSGVDVDGKPAPVSAIYCGACSTQITTIRRV